MSDGTLSQEEINALFASSETGGSSDAGAPAADAGGAGGGDGMLSSVEIDTMGEVANICMGTAATALFSLVNKKVDISTPVVSEAVWEEIANSYERPCVLIRIGYTKGIDGSNVLVLRENDVKVITDLMMGGDGTNVENQEIGEIQLSAISEAMNQMMGSAATSLSSMLNRMVDISPPTSNLVNMEDSGDGSQIDEFLKGEFVKIEFSLQIGDLVDSKLMQLYPVSLVKEMTDKITSNMQEDTASAVEDAAPAPETPPAPAPAAAPPPQAAAPQAAAPQPGAAPMMGAPMMPQQPVNVQPAQFQPLAGGYAVPYQPENIDLIMDVPLEVTVELGRTHKSIQDILDFAPGTIIELNKIAGEPIDVLVNGKYVAKGEVVVIEEAFGIRITEIMK
ncbi:MAG: flagellar motor switch phosphatase FliY [Lachnospiraceae bacterium]|nr:flagellar motor switch phosphatase FliY [Lachnospiraceae bacterium]